MTGELVPIKLVSDNGPAYKAASFAGYIAARPEFEHIRTRRRSPHTNGVIERSFGTLKYEHLYREEISDGIVLAAEVEYYRSHQVDAGQALKRTRCCASRRYGIGML